jgi:hypothetical protein
VDGIKKALDPRSPRSPTRNRMILAAKPTWQWVELPIS